MTALQDVRICLLVSSRPDTVSFKSMLKYFLQIESPCALIRLASVIGEGQCRAAGVQGRQPERR